MFTVIIALATYHCMHTHTFSNVSQISHKVLLTYTAVALGLVVTQPDTLLCALRRDIDKLFWKASSDVEQKLTANWCFLDSKFIANKKPVCVMSVFVSTQRPPVARHIRTDFIVFNKARKKCCLLRICYPMVCLFWKLKRT